MATTPSDIDQLFQLPLSEFTAARNALAARLKAAGHGEQATAVRALPKPPVSAWVVNQLHWRHRQAFDKLMTAGERLRKAQTSQLAGRGGDMRAPIEAHRVALEDLTGRAAALLRDAGHAPTPDLTRRITITLEALAARGRQSSAAPAGRLTADEDPPGFGALAALAPRKRGRVPGSGPSRVIPFHQRTEAGQAKKSDAPRKLDAAGKERLRKEERKVQRAAAVAALRDAERSLRDARKAAARAESALRQAAARTKVADKEKATLEKRLEKATADADDARRDARHVASVAAEAAQAVEDAELQVQTSKLKVQSEFQGDSHL